MSSGFGNVPCGEPVIMMEQRNSLIPSVIRTWVSKVGMFLFTFTKYKESFYLSKILALHWGKDLFFTLTEYIVLKTHYCIV